MAPKDLHSQIPGTWDYATLHRKSREGSACCKGQTRETAISEWCTGAAERFIPWKSSTATPEIPSRPSPWTREPNVKHLPTFDQLVWN